jgi:hypothetical protein
MIPTEFFTFSVIGTVMVLIVIQLVRPLRTASIQKTLRKAIDRDASVVPALMEGGIEPASAPQRDDRNGMLLIATGLALALFGVIQGDADDIRNLCGAALFPGLTGIAVIVYHRWMRPALAAGRAASASSPRSG